MAYSNAESWQINVKNFLISIMNWFSTVKMPSVFGYMLILDILFLVGTQPEQGNKSLDIIRRNANFSVVGPTANVYKFQ